MLVFVLKRLKVLLYFNTSWTFCSSGFNFSSFSCFSCRGNKQEWKEECVSSAFHRSTPMDSGAEVRSPAGLKLLCPGALWVLYLEAEHPSAHIQAADFILLFVWILDVKLWVLLSVIRSCSVWREMFNDDDEEEEEECFLLTLINKWLLSRARLCVRCLSFALESSSSPPSILASFSLPESPLFMFVFRGVRCARYERASSQVWCVFCAAAAALLAWERPV